MNYISARTGAVLLAMPLLLGMCGCIKQSILVQVNPDGSGNIVVSRMYPRDTVDSVSVQQAYRHDYEEGEQEPTSTPPRDPFYSQKSLEREARSFGTSVRFVKAKPFDGAGARGWVALYSFADINEVYVDLEKISRSLQSTMSGHHGMGWDEDDEESMGMYGGREQKSDLCVDFKFTAGAPARLQAIVPAIPENDSFDPEEDLEGEEEAEDDEENEDSDSAFARELMGHGYGGWDLTAYPIHMYMGRGNQKDYVKRTLQGLKLELAMEVKGTVESTTSKHADSSKRGRIVLVDYDGAKIASSPEGAKIKPNSFYQFMSGPERLFSVANKLPGAFAETNREVTVVFK